jgi:hypothetical protein
MTALTERKETASKVVYRAICPDCTYRSAWTSLNLAQSYARVHRWGRHSNRPATPSVENATFVCEGWWHPNVKKGQVHDHPERPGGSWSVASHRLCEPVYTKRVISPACA